MRKLILRKFISFEKKRKLEERMEKKRRKLQNQLTSFAISKE